MFRYVRIRRSIVMPKLKKMIDAKTRKKDTKNQPFLFTDISHRSFTSV